MPNVKFLLKEKSSQEKTLINMFFRFNNQVLKFSTSQKINPKFWNFEKQRVKETQQFREYPEFNALLNNYETQINNVYRKLLNDNKVITPELLKIELKKVLNNKCKNKNDIFEFIEGYIKNSKNKKGTISNYKLTLNKLYEFEKYSKRSINFDNINLDFYNEFVKFLNGKNYQMNYVALHIKNIKTIMNEATERKLNNNLEFKSKGFKKIVVESESIYLSIDEINKIYELDLLENEKLDKVRDLFIIGCYTGLRFSDLKEINSNNIINNGTMLKIKTEKTGEMVIIPLHRTIKEIIKKYNGEVPKNINSQLMNINLKEVGKLAGLNEKISIAKIKGGQTIKEVFNKYDLISAHTARRSFATNAYLMDIPAISIMKITGHKTERMLMKYIKISQEDNANKLINHPFFK